MNVEYLNMIFSFYLIFIVNDLINTAKNNSILVVNKLYKYIFYPYTYIKIKIIA